MGLDMYLNTRKVLKGEDLETAKKLEEKLNVIRQKEWSEDSQVSVSDLREKLKNLYEPKEVGYWRKHPDLHVYLEKIWRDRGNDGEFNCKELFLSKEDCEEILDFAQNVADGTIKPETGVGFFFGESCLKDWVDTIDIFTEVLQCVDFEKTEIIYDSWW